MRKECRIDYKYLQTARIREFDSKWLTPHPSHRQDKHQCHVHGVENPQQDAGVLLQAGAAAPRSIVKRRCPELGASIMEAPLIIHKHDGSTLFIVLKLIIYLAQFLQKSST